MLKRLTIAALSATLLAGAAQAAQQAPGGPGPDPMAKADADKNGVITRAEMLADVDARFKEMDANHDGKVTPQERAAFHEAMRARMASKAGVDAKVLTLDEEHARANRMFDMMDTNHDGKIDAAERAAARRKMAMRGPGGPGGRHMPPPPGDDMPPPPPADGPAPEGGE
jgi:ABC-type glycerol-3-phosphate transport system substrate-binding protein